MIELALYEPDIAPNVGTLARLAACLAMPIHVIEPCGFAFSAQAFKRAAMDYLAMADLRAHDDWSAFLHSMGERRLVLLTTRGDMSYGQFHFHRDDVILVGRESAGVPESVHRRADARLAIPMREGARSLNVAVAAAMVVGEALRQTEQFPASRP